MESSEFRILKCKSSTPVNEDDPINKLCGIIPKELDIKTDKGKTSTQKLVVRH